MKMVGSKFCGIMQSAGLVIAVEWFRPYVCGFNDLSFVGLEMVILA